MRSSHEGSKSSADGSRFRFRTLLFNMLKWEVVVALSCLVSAYTTRNQSYQDAYNEGFKDGHRKGLEERKSEDYKDEVMDLAREILNKKGKI